MDAAEHLLFGLGYTEPSSERSIVRLSDAGVEPASVVVAEEVPVALVYNGRPHVVVMSTPADLEDLAIGFSITEGVVANASAVGRVDVVRASHGVEVQIEIAAADADRLQDRARMLAARTGCGLCGVETIGDALRVPGRVQSALHVSAEALWRAGGELTRRQSLNHVTSTVHAAGWGTSDGVLHVVREDIGRHNALDKVLGALARAGTQTCDGLVVVTSRASYEMVQKAAAIGVELIAAVSRPTGLAIQYAELAGMTLVGLLRGRSANVYTGMHRISGLP